MTEEPLPSAFAVRPAAPVVVAEQVEVTLITCFITTNMALLDFADGTRRMLRHEGHPYVAFEGRRGLALISDGVLVEFHPHPQPATTQPAA